MSDLRIRFIPVASAFLTLLALLGGTSQPSQAQAPLIITMRPMQSPLALGQCTIIEVVVTDASGRAPVRPDGKQVSGWDVDLSLAAPTADAFGWGDEGHRSVCALTPSASYAIVSAHYPAGFLKENERLGTAQADASVQVMQGTAAPPAQYSQQPAAPPAQYSQQPAAPPAQYSQQPAAPAAPTSQPAPSPAGPAPGQPYVPPAGATSAPVQSPDYSQPGAPQPYGQTGVQPQSSPAPTQTAYAPPAPVTGPAQAVATQPNSQPGAYAAPAPAPAPAPVAVAAPTAPPAPAQLAEKGGGGFFKKLGKHLKDKASEVSHQTAENLSATANQMVDVTAQTGSNLVSGAAAQATSVAQSAVGGVTSSLVPGALRVGGNADNLSAAVASGEAVLRMMRFIGNTDVLDATGRDLVKRLAGVLNATPGNFVIQAHVDPLPAPAEAGATQVLSEHRAATVKAALINSGVAANRLVALGYGSSQPLPEAPPEGGPPSSARIVIARTQ